MKKIKELFKKNIKLVIGFIIGGIVFGTIGVYAATALLSQSVYYNNSTSGASSTNVQGALDELYTKALNAGGGIDSDSIDFSTIATNSAKKVLASSKGICINRNGKLNCFKKNNFSEEQNHIQEVFSDVSCDVHSYFVNCIASDFDCLVDSAGEVLCYDDSGDSNCDVPSDGSVHCR